MSWQPSKKINKVNIVKRFGPFFIRKFQEGPPRFPYNDTVYTFGAGFRNGNSFSIAFNTTVQSNKKA